MSFFDKFQGLGDMFSLMGGGGNIEEMGGKLINIISNPMLVNQLVKKMQEGWDEWEKKEGYSFKILVSRAPGTREMQIEIWADENGTLKRFRTFTKKDIPEFIKMFADASASTNAPAQLGPGTRH